MNYQCAVCGQYHDTTACPPCQIPPGIPALPLAEQAGNMTINGMTTGEQAIIERLDRLIALVQTRPERALEGRATDE